MSHHARLSLSQAATWMVCAAWPRMVQDVGEEISPAIQFGNDSHAILEQLLLGEPEPAGMEEERDCAIIAYDYVQKRWDEMGITRTTCLAEAEVKILSTGRTDLWGSADVILYNDEVLEIIDLKTGAGTYVNEHTSAQLKLYALAALETFDLHPKEVILTIVQPRYWDTRYEPIRSITLTPQDLNDWLTMTVTPAAEKTDNPDARGTVTDNCKKCAGRHVCEFRDGAVAEALTGMPDTITTTMEVTEVAIRNNQDVTVYDNERLSQVLNLIPVIQNYCKDLEAHAQEIIMKGEQVQGFKVVATGGRSKWSAEEDVKAALYKTKVAKDAYKQVLKTPKQVLSLVPKTNKKLAAKLEGLVTKSSGSLKLVRESEPGESAAPAFEVIPQEPVAPALPSFLL